MLWQDCIGMVLVCDYLYHICQLYMYVQDPWLIHPSVQSTD